MAGTVRSQVEQYCQKFGVPMRQTPGPGTEPEVRGALQMIGESVVGAFEAAFGSSFDMVASELKEAVQIDRLDHVDLVALIEHLGRLDQASELLRAVLGVAGDPVAEEIGRSELTKVRISRYLVARTEASTVPDVAARLSEQGWKP